MRDYNILGLLGKGAFSQVFKCVHIPTDKEYAMKVMSKTVIQKKKMSSTMGREIAIMKMLDHPHVVVMREALGSAVELFLVLDLVPGGTLREALANGGKFEEIRAKRYMLQLCDGLMYCHSRNVCHRDLKPDNLMLDENDNLKIADFGLGNFTIDEGLLYTRCGTPHYVSPEVIDGQKGYDGKIADVWSSGVILYRMLAGRVPFREQSTHMLYTRIRGADYVMPKGLTDDVIDVLVNLLVPNPHERMTLRKATEHAWFKEVRKIIPEMTHSQQALMPSDYQIAAAIKPILKQKSFQMARPSYSPANSLTPSPSAGASTPASASPAAAAASASKGGAAPAAASAAPAVETVLVSSVKIEHKSHKLHRYTTMHAKATVSIDATQLNAVVANKEVKDHPFPLTLLDAFSMNGKNKKSFGIKLPRSVLPKAKYFRFTCDPKSDQHAKFEKLFERLSKRSVPDLP